MKLLIITQKVDRTDPILGFFHRWIAEFAQQCQQVTVIGQLVGSYDLPSNVSVHSLGKEDGKSRISQVLLFWSKIWAIRNEYDCVLVHMTPIWIVLGAPIWLLAWKRKYLWYEARGTRWPLRLALLSVRKVFSASERGMPLKTRKSVITGHGIDTEQFHPGETFDKGLIITVGRITRSKRIELLLALAHVLPKSHLSIVGAPITREDKHYACSIEQAITHEHMADRVTMGAVTQEELVLLLQKTDVFVQASETALDKALLEAMSCGVPVATTSKAAKGVIPDECIATDDTLGDRVHAMLEMSAEERGNTRRKLRGIIEEHHSLPRLVEKLVFEMG